MLKYPSTTPSQQPILAPLETIINQVPACELWIAFASKIEQNISNLSVSALKNAAKIANNLRKVFDYLHSSQTQSLLSSVYLLSLSQSANEIYINTSVAAIVNNGTTSINLSVAAQNALSVLNAWDPVQGYQTPNDPGGLATTVLKGVGLT